MGSSKQWGPQTPKPPSPHRILAVDLVYLGLAIKASGLELRGVDLKGVSRA